MKEFKEQQIKMYWNINRILIASLINGSYMINPLDNKIVIK